MFQPLENNRPFLKMAFEGFAGDGKTFTATMIAIGLHKLIRSEKPIALFDTEKAFKALKKDFEAAGIKAVVNDQNRSLAALSEAIRWCEEGGADILIIDSITHVWEEFTEAYKKQKNRKALEFQDWGVIKPRWKREFSTPFVNAQVHILFTGRAGYEYSDEKNEETGRREIFKSGIKMKAEAETAFEPDLLVLMEKKQNLLADKKTIYREAIVLKDRTNQIDGMQYTNPTFEDFYPAIKVLLDGTLRHIHGVDMPDSFQEYESRYSEIARERELYTSDIEGVFALMGLGTGADDKQKKAWTLNQVFGVHSMEGLAKVSMETLQAGMLVMKEFGARYKKYLDTVIDTGSAVDKAQATRIMKEAKDDIYAIS
jgi:hypothetical protein